MQRSAEASHTLAAFSSAADCRDAKERSFFDESRHTRSAAIVGGAPKIAIIGVGLMGGSVGMAALQRNVVREVMGIHPDSDPPELAMRSGATTGQTYVIEAGVADVDLVVVCTPAAEVTIRGRVAAEHCKPTTVITDAGEYQVTDRAIHGCTGSAIRGRAPTHREPCVGSGSSASGFVRGPARGADADGATDEGPAIRRTLLAGLGAETLRMTPDAHDKRWPPPVTCRIGLPRRWPSRRRRSICRMSPAAGRIQPE